MQRNMNAAGHSFENCSACPSVTIVAGIQSMIRALLTAVVAAAVSVSAAIAAELRVISTNGMGEVIAATRAKFEAATRHTVTAAVAEPGEVRRRVVAGQPFDVIIAPSDVADELIRLDKIVPGTVVALVRLNFGFAVSASGSRPDFSTPEALKRALLQTNTVVVSDPAMGAISSEHFMEVLNKLGIAEQMKDKIVRQPSGEAHATRVAQGQADLAVKAEHQIRCTMGAAFVDYPVALQRRIALVGGVGTAASDVAAAKSYLSFLTGPEATTAYGANCLRPPAPVASDRP